MQETKPTSVKEMEVEYVDACTNSLMIAGAAVQMIKS